MSILFGLVIVFSFLFDFLARINSKIYYFIKATFILGNLDFMFTRFLQYENDLELLVYIVLTLILLPFTFSKINPKKIPIEITKNYLFLYSLLVVTRLYCFNNGLMYGTLAGTHLPLVWYDNIIGLVLNSGLIFIIFGERNYKLMLILFLEAVWLSLSGSKLGILILCILFIIKYDVKLTKRYLFLGILIIGMLPFIFSVARYSRVYIQNKDSIDLNAINLDVLFQNNIGGVELIERMSTAYYLDNIITYRKKNPFVNLDDSRFLLPFLWFIPRALWQEKPMISYGEWVGENVYGWTYSTRSEQAVTFFGDLYITMGAYSYIIYPFVLSVIGWILYHISLKFPYGLLYSLSQIFTMFEGNVNVIIINVMQNTLFMIIIYQLLKFLKKWRIS